MMTDYPSVWLLDPSHYSSGTDLLKLQLHMLRRLTNLIIIWALPFGLPISPLIARSHGILRAALEILLVTAPNLPTAHSTEFRMYSSAYEEVVGGHSIFANPSFWHVSTQMFLMYTPYRAYPLTST